MPHFEEIWPSGKKKDKYTRGHIPMDYYTDAMENGPGLTGMYPMYTVWRPVGRDIL